MLVSVVKLFVDDDCIWELFGVFSSEEIAREQLEQRGINESDFIISNVWVDMVFE